MRPEIPAEESLQAAVLQFSDSEKKSVVQANFNVEEVGPQQEWLQSPGEYAAGQGGGEELSGAGAGELQL